MRLFALMTAFVAISFFTAESFAAPPGAGEGGKKGQRAGGPGGKGAGQGQRGQGQGQRGSRDPSEMARMMIQRFDKDGDQKLDATELGAAMTAMRQRGGQGQGPGQGQGMRRRPGGPGQAGAGKPGGKAGGKRNRGDDAGVPGGERPKRPGNDV